MSEYLIVLIVVSVGVAAVLIPLLRSGTAGTAQLRGDAEIDAAVGIYRAALRDGTVCRKCLRANPAGSRFCADCGASLTPRAR